MEKIKGRYKIADCEHWGDVQNSIDFIKELGGEVIEHYWNRQDCGEAWIEFYCNPEFVKRAYKSSSFSFECDIKKYINLREESINEFKKRYTIINSEEYEKNRNQLISNVGDGFMYQIPIELIFKMGNYGVYNTPSTKIESFMCHIGNKVKVNSIKIEDDTYSVLLTCHFDDVSGVVTFITSQFWFDKEDLISVKPIHNLYKFGNIDNLDAFVAFKELVYNIAYDDNKLRFIDADNKHIEVDVEDFITDNKLIDFNYNGYRIDTENPVVMEAC